MRTRHQKGYVYRKFYRWYVRFYDDIVQDDGSIKRVRSRAASRRSATNTVQSGPLCRSCENFLNPLTAAG